MRNGVAGALGLLVISLLFSLLAHAQAGDSQELPSRGGTIRTQTAEVLVDVVVSDRKNRLVTDLGPQDFVIYEDGVPQVISSFRIYRSTPAISAAAPSVQPSVTETVPTPFRAIPNLTILLLDYSTTQFENQKLVREASIKYVEEKLRPNDLMAVFVLGAGLRFLEDFTDDRERLVAALRAGDVTGSALAFDRGGLSAGIDAAQSSRMQAGTFNLPSGLSGPGAAAAASGLGASGSSQGAAMLARRIAAQYYALRSALDERQGRNVLTAIRAIALGVREIEGRKTLILFSEGFVVGANLEEELHSVVDVANRSQLAVYCIESTGLAAKSVTDELLPRDELYSISANVNQQERMKAYGGESNFDRARQVGSDTRESALRHVANATGGFLIRNTNDLGIGLARVDEEMRSYYLLSYRPKNQDFDGQFREIRAEVRRPGLSARARSGYYAVPPGFECLTPEEFRLCDRGRNADGAIRVPLFLRAAGFQDEGGLYRVPVILEIPTAAVRFDKAGGGYSTRLQIIGLVRNSEGDFCTRFGGAAQVNATEAEYNVLKPGNLSFLNTVRLPPGRYSFEVTIRDMASDTVGHQEQGLYLREPEPRLALSSILLGKDVDKAVNAASEFLAVQGVKILPSARCQFRNGDNLIFYFDIYHPRVEPATRTTDVSVEVRLLREGHPVNAQLPRFRVNEYVAEPIPHITVARYLQLAGLAPGTYSLVVDVSDSGRVGQTARAQTAFSVVN